MFLKSIASFICTQVEENDNTISGLEDPVGRKNGGGKGIKRWLGVTDGKKGQLKIIIII